jgi:hypothetical protein
MTLVGRGLCTSASHLACPEEVPTGVAHTGHPRVPDTAGPRTTVIEPGSVAWKAASGPTICGGLPGRRWKLKALFTGDTIWDVRACRKAGVPCIGLLSGGISGDELTADGAAEVYPGPADLLAALRGSLLGRRER